MQTSLGKVMVVEDELVLQDVYGLVLEAKGYQVVTANNGLEALQKLPEARPDVVLLDMLMPIMGGKEFMRNINLEDYPGLKVIVYTNLSDSSIKAEMLQLGAHRFELKASMTPADLVRMIEELKA